MKVNYPLLTLKSSEYLREKFELFEGNTEDETVAVVEVADEHLEIESSSSESYSIILFFCCWLKLSYNLQRILFLTSTCYLNKKKLP